jgi:arylsulfatase A-like enzyme
MLDETLVVWTSEFGRSPWPDSPEGRSHHVSVYSSWLAGGGVPGGIAYGASDEFGNRPAENPVHVHDFHATILHQLGFDHTKLTFRHAGRDFRLTDVAGKVVQPILRGA